MADGLIDTASRLLGIGGDDEQVQGIALAQVVDNVDLTGEGRVQISLPWLPGFEPWARVCVIGGGSNRGLYYQPQPGDEVLVAMAHGDVTEPFVIGCLWNSQDKPPVDVPTDASSKVMLRTPGGHVVELDDLVQSVTITTIGGQKAVLDQQKIQLEAGSAKATFETSGRIEISGTDVVVKGTSLKLEATSIDVKAGGSMKLDGGGSCTVQAGLVKIN